MSVNYSPSGIMASSGNRYVLIPTESLAAAIPIAKFYVASANLPADLASRGVTVPTKKDLELLIQAVSTITHFEPGDVAEHPGWCGEHFARHDGSVIGPDPARVHVVFRPNAALAKSSGTMESWIANVVSPVMPHPIAAFGTMAAMLPAVKRFMPQLPNITIEWVGDINTGKSVMQEVAASVAHAPGLISSLRDVQRDLKTLREIGCDSPLVIDHVGSALLTATKPKKAELYALTAYDLPRGPEGRVTLLSGRHPLREACGIMAADESVLTLRIPVDEHGVFDHVPDGFANCAEFADSLRAAAAAHHGHAYPLFLQALSQSGWSATQIERRLEGIDARFRKKVRTNGFGNVPHRVQRDISAIYAVGVLARKLKILPARFPCMSAALAALGMCQDAQAEAQPFHERMEDLISSGKLVTIDKGANASVLAQAALAALGTIVTKPTGRVVRISPAKIAQAFPDWERIKRAEDVRALLKVDGKNLAVWGQLAPGTERIRLFKFELPLAEEPTLFSDAGTADCE